MHANGFPRNLGDPIAPADEAVRAGKETSSTGQAVGSQSTRMVPTMRGNLSEEPRGGKTGAGTTEP